MLEIICCSALFLILAISSRARTTTGFSSARANSILDNISASRVLRSGICWFLISLTIPVSLVFSVFAVFVACVCNWLSCCTKFAIRSCCAVTHASNARRVLPPNSPSLVTPIVAWPSFILTRSLLCNLFVVTVIVSSREDICACIASTALLSTFTWLMRCSYSFALFSRRCN